jgi:hypothetical protein
VQDDGAKLLDLTQVRLLVVRIANGSEMGTGVLTPRTLEDVGEGDL